MLSASELFRGHHADNSEVRSIRPSGMPKARRQLLRHLDNPRAPIRANTGTDVQHGLDLLSSHLRVAELFWVSQDMTALAMSSGSQLDAARWATADRPAPCGLIWFDGGIGQTTFQGVDVPVDGVVWGPGDEGCLLWTLVDRKRVAVAAAQTGRMLVVEETPPLFPIVGEFLSTDREVSMAALPEGMPAPVAQAVAAAWLLMQQPVLVDRVRERADGPTRRQHARDGLPAPEVTVVDLRRQYVPQDQDQDPDAGGDGRRYRHRWVVSGHWRNQAHGPDRSLRRRRWIPSYVKGPEGAPLLSTERVNVWRR